MTSNFASPENEGWRFVVSTRIVANMSKHPIGPSWKRNYFIAGFTTTTTIQIRIGELVRDAEQNIEWYFLQLLNRRPPFGQEVIASAQELPQYSLEIQQVQVRSGSGNEPVEVDLSVHCGLVDRHDNVKAKKPKRREANMTVVYAVTSDLDFIDFRRTSYVCPF